MSDADIAIVLGHGDLAAGLVSAVHAITGLGARFRPISNSGLGNAEIEKLLREALDATGAHVVFTDLPAGSCNFAACRLLRERADLVVVTGVNLPALLQFALHGEAPSSEAAAEAAERGAQALRFLTGKPRGD
jgi:PTS system N-acetylgalactosamine-specific IIA component